MEEKPDQELNDILWACREYCKNNPENRFCYAWIKKIYFRQYNKTFHQSRLKELAKLEYLMLDDASRGGKRRYYCLVRK